MSTIIGIVMKPFLTSQTNNSLWKDLYVKQDFADIFSKYDATCIGIIPQGIPLDRVNSDAIDLSKDNELTEVEKEHLVSQINLCDGLILQGGLSSHKYEVFIAQYAIEHNIPILGVCAGFNNIARAIDVEVGYDKELAEKHDIYSPECCHSIIIRGDAKILTRAELSDEVLVNSIHTITLHSAAIRPSNKRINVEAFAIDSGIWGIPNKTVEAFSVNDTKFCLAIKWHPELLPDDKVSDLIFKKFIEAAKM